MRFLSILSAASLVLIGCGDSGTDASTGSTSGATGGETSSSGGSTSSSSDSSSSSGGSGPLKIVGGVEKGPFVIGSSVAISGIDATGVPTGSVVNTQTTDNTGAFDVTVADPGLASIEASGYYFNEITAKLSTGSLTLRAYVDLGAAPSAVYVNIITHLTYLRVKSLIAGGATLASATAQAESELRDAMKITPAGFDPNADADGTSLFGGDDDADAYLFAVGAVFLEAAKIQAGESGSIDGEFQQILNQAQSDFSNQGKLPDATVDLLEQATTQVSQQVGTISGNLKAQFQTLGSSAVVPDMRRVLDPDQDGIADKDDNCPYIANADQLDTNHDGVGDACGCGNGHLDVGEECDDGNLIDTDGCESDCTATCHQLAEAPNSEHTPILYLGAVNGVGVGGIFTLLPEGSSPDLIGCDVTSKSCIGLDEKVSISSGNNLGAVLGNAVYFNSANSNGDNDIWKTDGTVAGTVDSGILAYARGFVSFKDSLYLLELSHPNAIPTDDHLDVVRTDGTGNVAETVASDVYPGPFEPLGNNLLFFVYTSDNDPSQVWVTDGTASGTTHFTFNPFVTGETGYSGGSAFAALGKVFFGVHATLAGVSHDDVWVTDGTSGGTFKIASNVSLSTGVVLGSKAFFGTTGNSSATSGIWMTDGTAAGTSLVKAHGSAYPDGVASAGVVYSVASQANVAGTVNEPDTLWWTDGTTSKELSSKVAAVSSPIQRDNKVYFFTDTEFWVTDGTSAGTHRGAQVAPPIPQVPGDAYSTYDATQVYFGSAADSGTTYQPWICKAK